MAAENKEMEEMTQRAVRRKGGAQSEPDESPAEPPASQLPPEESPLDFAKSVYRDASQPMPLRASMARAALPYTLARVQPSERSDEDARESKPWPFNMPDPYGAIRPDWRAVLEKAGLIPSEEQWRAAFM